MRPTEALTEWELRKGRNDESHRSLHRRVRRLRMASIAGLIRLGDARPRPAR
jgi:hypothetical protein